MRFQVNKFPTRGWFLAVVAISALLAFPQTGLPQAIFDSQSFGSSFGGGFGRSFEAPPPPPPTVPGEEEESPLGQPLEGEGTDQPVGEPTAQRFFGPLALIAQLPFDVIFSASGGYDTNPNFSSFDPAPSAFAGVNLGLNYAFGNPRLQLTTSLRGGLTFFSNSEVREPNRFNGNWSLTSTYNLTPRIIFSANANIGYFSQPNINVSGTTLSQDGDYIAGTITLLGLYQLSPRFSTTLSYTFSPIVYREPLLNDDLGRVQQTLSWAMNYALRPTTTLVVEYRASPTDYFSADLNTFDNFFLLGFDQVFSPRSSWNFRGGVQYNFLNNPIDGQSTYLGPYAETGFTYRYGERSNIFLSLRLGTEASGQRNITQRQTLRVGASINHAFGPRLSANIGLFGVADYYNQANVIEPYYQYNYQASVSLNYQWNRFVSFSAGYTYTTIISPTFPTQEYDRGIGTIGVNLNF